MSKETPPGVDEGKGMARQDVAVGRRKEIGKYHKHGVFMLEMWTRVLNGIEDQAVIFISAQEAHVAAATRQDDPPREGPWRLGEAVSRCALREERF